MTLKTSFPTYSERTQRSLVSEQKAKIEHLVQEIDRMESVLDIIVKAAKKGHNVRITTGDGQSVVVKTAGKRAQNDNK